MLLRTHLPALLAPALLLTTPLTAQVEGQRNTAPAGERSVPVHDIDRWIDDRVFGVVVIDVEHADVGALLEQLGRSVSLLEPGATVAKAELERFNKEMLEGKAVADGWLKEFREAGGREAWLLLAPEPAFCVPLTEGADTARLTALIKKAELPGADGKLIERNRVLFAGSTLRGLPRDAADPDRVKQLESAFASIASLNDGKPVVRLAMIPTDNHRLVLAAAVPKLAEMAGVQVAKDLNGKLQWAAAGISTLPSPDFKVVIQTTGNLPAQQTASLFNGLINMTTRDAPPSPLLENLRQVRFIANEDRAELTLTAASVKQLAAFPAIAMIKAREAARRAVAMSVNRQHLTAVMTYATDHDDKLPDRLDDLKEYLGADLKHPEGKNWIYIKPAARLAEVENPSGTVILHEEFKVWPEKGLIVGFADGHVELVETEARFEELLKPQ